MFPSFYEIGVFLNNKIYLTFITCRDKKEAKKIALSLLEKRLIACANIVPKIESYFQWKGKIEHANEALLLCKTTEKKITQVEREVKRMHSYELPAIEFMEISASKEYANWVEKENSSAKKQNP